ncbi:MAG: plasmid pRiA4b ORF-3 family protein [Deferribacteraceae bacterium]|jgi:hypothetical protein|nr:plasmid pRiA4b ORF-3 family protein [Deferribacteraceae bacterium]
MEHDDFKNFPKEIRCELDNEDIYIPEGVSFQEADKITLSHIIARPARHLTFNYDYGDNWEVSLKLEEYEKREVSLAVLPRVIDGAGFGIIEDVGETCGLAELAKALKKDKGESHEEYCAWLDSKTLNLEAFDIEDMNFCLKKLLHVYGEVYECELAPTKQMQEVLFRKYKGKDGRGY